MYAGMVVRKHDLFLLNGGKLLFVVLLYIGLSWVGGDFNLSVRMYGTSVLIYFILG